MKKFILLSSVLVLFACGQEEAKRYVFDQDELQNNLEQYVKSSGPMDRMACGFMSLVFTNEVFEAIQAGKEPDLMDGGEELTPMEISVYKDKIEWGVINKETKIIDDKVSIDSTSDEGVEESFNLTISSQSDEQILFYYKEGDDEFECEFPFKRVK